MSDIIPGCRERTNFITITFFSKWPAPYHIAVINDDFAKFGYDSMQQVT